MDQTARKLGVVSPVPVDIDIANSVEPLHISEIVQDLNLSSQHYDLYGKYKAKIVYSTLEFLVHGVSVMYMILDR
ncbi:hypothetical protein BC332_01435 [Capsicum chinense]|nr:hypothetical protein BC332_01435 [Capsicum chinense]